MRKRIFTYAVCLCILFNCLNISSAATSSKNYRIRIDQLSVQLKTVFDNFISQAVKCRLGYYYTGRLINTPEKARCLKIALRSIGQLDKILKNQQEILTSIEQYQASDWDIRFGKTGLYRQLKAAIEKNNIARIEILYWLSKLNVKKDTSDVKGEIDKLLSRWSKLSMGGVGFKKLLLARIVSIQDPLKALEVYSDIAPDSLDDNLRITRIIELSQIQLSLNRKIDVNSLNAIVNSPVSSQEQKLCACFILKRASQDDIIGKFLSDNPKLKPFVKEICFDVFSASDTIVLASLKSDDISKKQFVEFSDTELKLIAEYLREAGCDTITSDIEKKLILLKKPYFDYILAVCANDSEPLKAAKLFLSAGNSAKADTLGLYDCEKAAYNAVVLSHKLYQQNKKNAPLALQAFQSLKSVSPSAFDDKLNYLYAQLLKANSKDDLYWETIKEISKSDSKFSIYARYDIALDKATTLQHKNLKLDTGLKSQLFSLVGLGNEEISQKASILLGQFLSSDSSDYAKEYIKLLTDNNISGQALFYKAKAHSLLSCDIDAVKICKLAVGQATDISANIYEIYKVVSTAADNIDKPDYTAAEIKNIVDSLDTIAEAVSRACRQNLFKNAVIASWLESSAYIQLWDSRKQRIWSKISSGKQSQSLIFVRCQARIDLMKKHYQSASDNWAHISRYYYNINTASGRLHWWRAKYYQVLSLLKSGNDNKSLKHHIDLLLADNKGQDNIWIDKIKSLSDTLDIAVTD